MHLYLLTRGIKQDVDRFVSEMSAKYLPFKFRKNVHDVNEPFIENGTIQVAMRPVQFWEVVFPEEHLDTVMKTLWPNGPNEGHWGNVATEKFKKYLWMIRRFLGADVKPLPVEFNPNSLTMPVYQRNIEFLGIGTKEDAKINGVEML